MDFNPSIVCINFSIYLFNRHQFFVNISCLFVIDDHVVNNVDAFFTIKHARSLLPKLFTTEFGLIVEIYCILTYFNDNDLRWVEKKDGDVYFTTRWYLVHDYYHIRLEGWITMLFVIKIMDRLWRGVCQ